MKAVRIYRSQSGPASTVIALFAGWAMDAEPFAGLTAGEADIVLFYSYAEGDAAPYTSLFAQYTNVIVLAWSYGAARANKLLTGREAMAVAVNATYIPSHSSLGIDPRIFNLTLRSVSDDNLCRFYASAGLHGSLPQRTSESAEAELRFFGNIPAETRRSDYWTAAYVSVDDPIIPSKAQQKAWLGLPINLIDGGHTPDFQKIIDSLVVDKKRVARSFVSALATYDSEAHPQRAIAHKLFDKLSSRLSDEIKPLRVLELGCGTGQLTTLYAPTASSDSVVVDLAPADETRRALASNGVDYSGQILSEDAEILLRKLPADSFDIVISSSVMQWFQNIPLALKNIYRVLKPGGLASIATMGFGTLDELRAVGAPAMTYLTAETLAHIVPRNFDTIELSCGVETISFDSTTAMISHLRNTGVNALSARPMAPGSLRELLRSFGPKPALSYVSLYLIARKPNG